MSPKAQSTAPNSGLQADLDRESLLDCMACFIVSQRFRQQTLQQSRRRSRMRAFFYLTFGLQVLRGPVRAFLLLAIVLVEF